MAALGVIHSPQIVALGAFAAVTSPLWLLEKIEENSRKTQQQTEKDSCSSDSFYKLKKLCNLKLDLEPEIADKLLYEINWEFYYFKQRENFLYKC
ncbi:hypothetical protein [Campylobacter sp. CCS1377]|uniref:Uncharacterized protein n=1 Tax=Campylobacter sp. CCS1377 TaxID=3158229 RepID=A0AAU7EA89_9BACT